MKKHIILLLTASLLGLSSCKDSFLDLKPYDSLPVSDALKTEADLSTALNGMYSNMRSSYLYGRTIPFIGDLMSDNVYLSATNSGRYLQPNNYTINAQNGDVFNTWSQAYAVILQANNIINSTITQSATVDQYKGEALTVRALMYFELVRLFGKPYASDPVSAGVPLVLTYDPTVRPARNTVKEVYDQITKDLTQAFGMMTGTRSNSSYVTKYVAESLLSKVYLYEKDYANAFTAAQDVITKGGYTLTTSTGLAAYWASPTPVTNKLETIFEVSADGVANVGFDALANIYNQAGYGDGLVSTDLYNLYSTTDARRSLIITGKRGGLDVLINNKYNNVTKNADKDDIKVLRLADVLLIAAESAARSGKETDALTYLNQLAQRRDPSLKAYTVTGSELLAAIITERRKELAFEGDRLNDLNRLGTTIIRNNQFSPGTQSIPAGDDRRILPIPQIERDANKQITQNSGY